MKKIALQFGLLAFLLLILFQLSKYSLFLSGFKSELLLKMYQKIGFRLE